MVINSKFKDYYDSIAHQYRDSKVVYNRKTEERNIDEFNGKFKNFISPRSWGPIRSSLFSKHSKYTNEGECNLLMIGGKIYPFTYNKNKAREDQKYTSDIWDFKNPYTCYDDYIKNQSKFFKSFKASRKKVNTGERMDEVVEFCQTIAPIILVWGDSYGRKRGCSVKLNPELNSFKPCVSPWEIVQDIMGILGSIEPNIPEMSNQEKIDSHGFEDCSFRPKMRKK